MTPDSDFGKEDAVQLVGKYCDGYQFPHKAHAIALLNDQAHATHNEYTM